MSQSHQLLILGGPNAGKTHFAGQLYNRLVARGGEFRMLTPPADLTVLRGIIDRLAQGLAGEHTQRGLHEDLHFAIARGPQQLALTFADYAGEQVRDLVRERLLAGRWPALVRAATEWLLLLRLDEVPPLEDITTRGFADLDDLRHRAAAAQAEGELSVPAFYVELLQLLLHGRGRSPLVPVREPGLTIVLSCWDTLGLPPGTEPAVVLRNRLPLLAEFAAAVWAPGQWRVCGLSSLGRSLDARVPDEDFVDEGPAAAGYVVLPTGEATPDLTCLLTFAR